MYCISATFPFYKVSVIETCHVKRAFPLKPTEQFIAASETACKIVLLDVTINPLNMIIQCCEEAVRYLHINSGKFTRHVLCLPQPCPYGRVSQPDDDNRSNDDMNVR